MTYHEHWRCWSGGLCWLGLVTSMASVLSVSLLKQFCRARGTDMLWFCGYPGGCDLIVD